MFISGSFPRFIGFRSQGVRAGEGFSGLGHRAWQYP